jgi:hypothetical protein
MHQDEFFKIVGILIVSFFIIYMIMKMFYLQSKVVEGLTGGSDKATPTSSGEAGTSSSYAASIKAEVVKLQDELLVAKYRKDYESVIIHLDDYVGFMMLKQVLNMKPGDADANLERMNALNSLKNAKDSLNATMAFLDKQ